MVHKLTLRATVRDIHQGGWVGIVSQQLRTEQDGRDNCKNLGVTEPTRHNI